MPRFQVPNEVFAPPHGRERGADGNQPEGCERFGCAPFYGGSRTERTAAAVIVAIRCCFAMGPRKSLAVPVARPSSRTYAVSTANDAAAHPSPGDPMPITHTGQRSGCPRHGQGIRSRTVRPAAPLPPSTATMPSKGCTRRRGWQKRPRTQGEEPAPIPFQIQQGRTNCAANACRDVSVATGELVRSDQTSWPAICAMHAAPIRCLCLPAAADRPFPSCPDPLFR